MYVISSLKTGPESVGFVLNLLYKLHKQEPDIDNTNDSTH